MTGTVWGIDLGGTKIEGVVLPSAESTEAVCRLRVPTEAEKGYDHILSQVRELVEAMSREAGSPPSAIGFGTPGVLDPDTMRIKNSNTTCLIGQPFQQDIERDLGVEVVLANDANCFALAEARLGAARGAEIVFGIILGTGVGGGIVIGDKTLFGRQGIAGEWGHNILDPQGPDCYCGRKGCVETFLSGPYLEKHYTGLSGQELSLPDIASLHQQGRDPHAAATMERLVTYFGRAVASVINILDPHVVVLGGGVSNIDLLYSEGVREAERWVFNDRMHTRVAKNLLGDSAGVYGAAMLVA